jgi:hypothetical protein
LHPSPYFIYKNAETCCGCLADSPEYGKQILQSEKIIYYFGWSPPVARPWDIRRAAQVVSPFRASLTWPECAG